MSYSEYKFNNKGAEYSHSYLTLPVLRLLNKENNKKILDIGCGNGYLIGYLLEKGFDAYGIDASISGINIAKGIHPDRFFLHNIENERLPEPINKLEFDTVISTEVIEHVYSPANFMIMVRSILNGSAGQVILSTPYHGYLKNLIIALSNKWDSHHTVLWEGGHIKFWSRKSLTRLLEENGFTVTNFVGCGRVPFLWKSMIVKAKLQ